MKKFLILVATFFALNTYAACPQFYPKNVEIVPANTVELCNTFFVNRFDKNNKATILSVEWLQKSKPSGSVTRINAFSADDRVGNSSPTNSDYSVSGYDRGHMAPAGDSHSPEEMKSTFKLTNMTPQEPTLNRNSWRVLEENIRIKFDSGSVDFKVLTLAMYQKPVKRIGANIPVPVGYWKIIYKNEVASEFYFAQNKPNAKVTQYTNVNVADLIKNSTNF
jgi:endonuclease G